jgi:spermidine synthase
MKSHNGVNHWLLDQEDENKSIYHRVSKQIFSVKTKFQDVQFLKCYGLGEVLVLDNKIQSAEFDEYIYHEALVHPAMFTHPAPKNVLVLGGGEGATIREVLKHSTVEKVTMVDIDGELVELCKKHLQKWHQNSFFDPRCNILYTDAWDYVQRSKEKFDVVIADISDPIEGGPALNIYTKDFYKLVYRILDDQGIFVTQAVEVFYKEKEYHSQINRTVSSVFPITESYCDYVPSFSAVWGFVIGSKRFSALKLDEKSISDIAHKRGIEHLRYYDHETHRRLFSLPRMVRERIMQQQSIATITHPIKVFSG